jgi:dUTP pyrophosphatase
MSDNLRWVNFKRLHPDSVVPKYQTEDASGFDLHSVEDVSIAPGQTVAVGIGLSFEIPSGYELQIRPRSGLSYKTKLRVANSPGTIDADYRGEVKVILDHLNNGTMPALRGLENADIIKIKKGDRIAQAVLVPVYRAFLVEKEELSETQRGEGRFGSTDKKKS